MLSEKRGVRVSWLYPGIALRAKPGVYIGDTGRSDSPNRYLTFNRDMSWWSDFHPGENEVLVYVGEKRSDTGRLMREVLWRGSIHLVRPYDWRHLELLADEEDISKLL